MNHSATKEHRLTETPGLKRAVIYSRARNVPPDAELDQAQLTAQEHACRQVAMRLSAEVVSEYRAVGGSTDPGVRQLVEKLLHEVERDRIDYLIVLGYDRLSRRPTELARIARRLGAAGTAIVTTAGPEASFLEAVSLFCLLAAIDNKRRTP